MREFIRNCWWHAELWVATALILVGTGVLLLAISVLISPHGQTLD